MLVASNPLLGASSFERERAVRKHVGDFALFLTSGIRGHVAAARGFAWTASIDYVKAGKESYLIVAAFDQFEYRCLRHCSGGWRMSSSSVSMA